MRLIHHLPVHFMIEIIINLKTQLIFTFHFHTICINHTTPDNSPDTTPDTTPHPQLDPTHDATPPSPPDHSPDPTPDLQSQISLYNLY